MLLDVQARKMSLKISTHILAMFVFCYGRLFRNTVYGTDKIDQADDGANDVRSPSIMDTLEPI